MSHFSIFAKLSNLLNIIITSWGKTGGSCDDAEDAFLLEVLLDGLNVGCEEVLFLNGIDTYDL